ncbi:CNPV178 putative IMV membrane protein [Canarypox virus]|uniref:SWPV2-ORF166 n=2 Tax=Canarypox virus TaxID=44088 RepID=A0A1V0QGD1_CNPV|nr:CNPV178 putative IMV membrane protein [Canarypox virus]ARE67402.1 SWPV2-ORF166 [Shearwaterpox virus]QRM15454.1 putative IMV membrane protein [Mudlarkpox virus]QRM15809.1 putative imv membrane protein [Penguinpox virus 2]QRM16144.1 putative imv membrane protein [Albatrosspox virus]AAR83524.1 CNPV178 putative IMV membrane protein [Canarypox virus]
MEETDQHLLTLFLTDDNSFYAYLAEKTDDEAIRDIDKIKNYMDFLLGTLIRSKEKLENIGCSYEPMSESFKTIIKVKDDGTLVKAFNKPLLNPLSEKVKLNRGYVSDFAISIIRLSKNNPFNLPKNTKYINPNNNMYISNLISILKSN